MGYSETKIWIDAKGCDTRKSETLNIPYSNLQMMMMIMWLHGIESVLLDWNNELVMTAKHFKQLGIAASDYRSVVSHGQNQNCQVYSVILLIRVIVCLVGTSLERLLGVWVLRVGHDLLDENIVVDHTVQVFHAVQQIWNFVVGKLLAQVHHDVTQLSGWDWALTVLVEDLTHSA